MLHKPLLGAPMGADPLRGLLTVLKKCILCYAIQHLMLKAKSFKSPGVIIDTFWLSKL